MGDVVTPLDLDAIVRHRCDVLAVASERNGSALLLDNRSGRYHRVPLSALSLLASLAGSSHGMAVREAAQRFPDVELGWLAERGLVEVLPVAGWKVSRRAVVRMAARNVAARLRIAVCGWAAVGRHVDGGGVPEAAGARPLELDEVEAVARHSFAVPGTSRLCTVVAMAIRAELDARGIASSLYVSSDADEPDPHAFVAVDGHRVDPSGDQNLAPELRTVADS